MQSFLHILYAVFIGAFLALFVGFGIAAFYEAPERPELSPSSATMDPDSPQESEENYDQYQQQSEEYEDEMEGYNTIVSGVAVGVALVIFLISLFAVGGIPVIADGLLFGGAFTLLYGVGRSFTVSDPQVPFLMLAVALPIVLLVGYMRFYRNSSSGGAQESGRG